ncbi:uncharacterized protein TNCV_3831971 [Trichonephila clavipes]|nr:uncharacterized protein TNCV_3831971 [Trichonephila clavipes]
MAATYMEKSSVGMSFDPFPVYEIRSVNWVVDSRYGVIGTHAFNDDGLSIHWALGADAQGLWVLRGSEGSDSGVTKNTKSPLENQKSKKQRNVSPEQEEDEREPIPTSAIKDILKKWEDVRAMVLEWHPYQADVSRFGDLYNNNAINYCRKILKMREKQSTLDMFFNAP